MVDRRSKVRRPRAARLQCAMRRRCAASNSAVAEIPPAAMRSRWLSINGVVVRAIRASNVENAACASSTVMSCIRTLRVVADANSEAARSLTHQQGRTRPQNCIGVSSQRVDGEQGYRDARVEIDTQRSSSSRILLTKVPASSSGNFLPTQRAASQSRSAGATGLACRGMASSSTTGRAMTRDDDSSPSSARSITPGAGSWRRRRCGCSLKNYSHLITLFIELM